MQPSDGEPDQPNEPLVVDLQEPRMEGELVDGTFAGIEEGLENLTGGDRFVIEILRLALSLLNV